MCPSIAHASSGTGATAVQTANRVGSSTRIGAIRPPSPATPKARNVTPPRNVPAAAPGRPFALAAIPAARFSVSNPESATESTNAEIPSVRATPKQPVDEHVGREDDHDDSDDEDEETGSSRQEFIVPQTAAPAGRARRSARRPRGR